MNMTVKAGAMMGFLSITGSETKADQLIESFGADADRRWGYVQDGVMGGVSQGQMRLESESDTSFARLTGTVSTDNNGGFIQFRAGITAGFPDWAQAIRLRVKGNGESYYVFLRTTDRMRPWHSYRAEFDTSEALQLVDLPLSSFKPSHDALPIDLDPAKISGIGFVAYGRDFEADLSVAELHLIGAN